MKFILQSDDVCLLERRAVQTASCLTDAKLFRLSLKQAASGDIDESIPTSAAPVGSVEFVTAVAGRRGVVLPPGMSYPDCLVCGERDFMRRKVRRTQFGYAFGDVFIKPADEIKRFTGCLLKDLPRGLGLKGDYPVWISDPVEFVSEWRYYVVGNTPVGQGRYDDGPDDVPEPDADLVHEAIELMKLDGAPAGYALDFGVLSDGGTALIEVNDGWALGYYKGTCSSVDYARLLAARWEQLWVK